jgi:HSP20 family molecular chaperone IbpA
MWEDDESDLFDEVEKRIDATFEEAYSSSVNWLFDLNKKSVKPLFRVDIGDGELLVTIDLPGVEKKDISLSATEDTLTIEAKMKRPISLMVGGSLQELVEFEKYTKRIRLPVKIEPDKARARVVRGILAIRFPLAHKGTILTIE